MSDAENEDPNAAIAPIPRRAHHSAAPTAVPEGYMEVAIYIGGGVHNVQGTGSIIKHYFIEKSNARTSSTKKYDVTFRFQSPLSKIDFEFAASQAFSHFHGDNFNMADYRIFEVHDTRTVNIAKPGKQTKDRPVCIKEIFKNEQAYEKEGYKI